MCDPSPVVDPVSHLALTEGLTVSLRESMSLVPVGAAAVTLNGLGYAVGSLLGRAGSRSTRIATVLSVGMRDFAVAAALVIAAGLPTTASLPAVAFGVVEMTTSAGLAEWFGRHSK